MTIKTVDAKTLHSWLENSEAEIIDVREPAEFNSEHISGAKLAPLGSLCSSNIPQIKNGKKFVIYCKKGGRGNSACTKLYAENSEMELYNLEGGIDSWKEAGFTVTGSGKKHLPLDRQVQLAIGTILILSSILGHTVSNALFLLTGLIGIGLTIAGATGFCGLARIIAKMPWNK
jgi:rhodanese-related sulfurtransferase